MPSQSKLALHSDINSQYESALVLEPNCQDEPTAARYAASHRADRCEMLATHTSLGISQLRRWATRMTEQDRFELVEALEFE